MNRDQRQNMVQEQPVLRVLYRSTRDPMLVTSYIREDIFPQNNRAAMRREQYGPVIPAVLCAVCVVVQLFYLSREDHPVPAAIGCGSYILTFCKQIIRWPKLAFAPLSRACCEGPAQANDVIQIHAPTRKSEKAPKNKRRNQFPSQPDITA